AALQSGFSARHDARSTQWEQLVGEPEGGERETLDWDRYGVAIRELAQLVANDGYVADIILAIARGGLFAAGSLGYALSVKNIYVMNVEFYTGAHERLD